MLPGLALLLASALGFAELGPVPPGALRVYLVRHGQAFSNLDPAPELPPERLDRLTPLGHEQSRRVGLALRGRGAALVLSSPAGRAQETAEEIRAALGAPAVRVEPRLRPLDLGRSATGKDLDWDERIAEWKAGRDPAPLGGESLEQVGRRVLDLVRSLGKDRTGASVVLVAHSEVLAAFIGHLQGTPAAQRYPPRFANGSVTVVESRGAMLPTLLLSNQLPPESAAPKP
jgi:broad specificity phosphatase PhoE